MIEFLDNQLTHHALLWRLERRDGVTLGFTSHDHDLVRGGLVFRASPGLLPSAIERSDGFDADTVDLSGALTSDAITEADLIAGRWDGAALAVMLVDWRAADGDAVPLLRGELGGVDVRGGGFSAGLRGVAAMLEAPANEETSPECRATLGDRRCRVDMGGRRRIVRTVSADGADVTVDQAAGDGLYSFGRARWIDGANAGLTAVIAGSAGAVISLRESPPFAPAPGDRIEIAEGCDRRFATCTGRFANAANFRGEPHLPGNDLLTRYAL